MEFLFDAKVLVSIAAAGVAWLLLRLYEVLVAKPERIRSALWKQGIRGPAPTFLLGNIKDVANAAAAAKKTRVGGPPLTHDCAPIIFPAFHQWRKQYGQLFTFAFGNMRGLYASQPDVVKAITMNISLDMGRPMFMRNHCDALLGSGIVNANGPTWLREKNIINPELYMEKVKAKISIVNETAAKLINSWKSEIEKAGGIADICIDEPLKRFSGEVVSRACFGNDYSNGEKIFSTLEHLEENMIKRGVVLEIPGLRYVPIKINREAWKLKKKTRDLILERVRERTKKGKEEDLFQRIIEAAKSEADVEKFIVDNCKTMYYAGYETTAVAAIWGLMLLSINKDWQERVRAEILEICQGQIPNADMVRKMKQLTMVIQETLRLYPSVPMMARQVFKDMKLGDIYVPKDTIVWLVNFALHTDPEIWGPDADKFNPERFANGISGATQHPHMYVPFGVGNRMCSGQNLAMTELKVLFSLILSNFSLSLSPKYVHSPVYNVLLKPEHGVNLLVKKL